MKRILVLVTLTVSLALPSVALGFHHPQLPATDCHAAVAGSPSNDNGQAKENLSTRNPNGLPLAPIGTPGNGQGDGGEHCANGEVVD